MKKLKTIIKNSLATVIFLQFLAISAHAATYDILQEEQDSVFTLNDVGMQDQSKVLLVDSLRKETESAIISGELDVAEEKLLKGLVKVKGNLKAEIITLQMLAKLYAFQQKPEKVLPISKDIAERYPDESLALSVLAGAYIINNENDLAEQALQKIINQDKRDIRHRLLLVKLISKTPGKEKQVFSLLDEVLQIDVNNPEALLMKADLQINQKQYQSALDTIKKIEQLYPQKAVVPILKGNLYFAKQDYERALGFFQQAYKIKPTNKVLFFIVDIMKIQQQESAAFDLLNNELETNYKNLPVHSKLANIYLQLKDYKNAEKHFAVIIAEQPDNAVALNNLAWIYSQQNKPEALELAKKAHEKEPNSAVIADTYGTILIKHGDKKQGLAVLQKAAADAPETKEIQYHLAIAYSLNGKNEQAKKILQKIMQTNQNFPEKQDALILLNKL